MERGYLPGFCCCFNVSAYDLIGGLHKCMCIHVLYILISREAIWFIILWFYEALIWLMKRCCLNSQISGLGLNGTMGYLLSGLMSLRIL